MNVTKQANLLTLAITAARSGEIDDSHEIFDLFAREVLASEQADEAGLAEAINKVLASALDEAMLSLDDELEEAANDDIDEDEDSHEHADNTLGSDVFFGGDADFTEASVEEDATNEQKAMEARIAANRAALFGRGKATEKAA